MNNNINILDRYNELADDLNNKLMVDINQTLTNITLYYYANKIKFFNQRLFEKFDWYNKFYNIIEIIITDNGFSIKYLMDKCDEVDITPLKLFPNLKMLAEIISVITKENINNNDIRLLNVDNLPQPILG